MLRRIATALAAAALGASALAVAAPAQAASVTAADRTYSETRIAGFHADPNPVRKYQRISLRGRLQVGEDCNPHERGPGLATRHNPCDGSRTRWTGETGRQRIVMLFRADGGSRWEYVETVQTGRDGRFRTDVPVYASGTWRVVFEGSRGLSPAQAEEWVKVVR